MRNVWRWWMGRKAQIRALVLLGLILLWMNLSLWQSQRHFRSAMQSQERLVKDMEVKRQILFEKLMRTSADFQGPEVRSLLDELQELRLLIANVIKKTVKGTVP